MTTMIQILTAAALVMTIVSPYSTKEITAKHAINIHWRQTASASSEFLRLPQL